MRCSPKPGENLKKAVSRIGEAARRGAGLVCLPELFRTRYFCQAEDPAAFDLAETVPGPTTDALAHAAKRHRVAVIGSVFERRAAGIHHNTAVAIDATGRIASVYRKMHIPDDPRFYEKYYFVPGDLGVPVAALGGASVSVLVCWDQWFPEAARLAALAGAQVLLYPTAIGWHREDPAALRAAQADAWRTIQRAHAIANGVFVASVNRVGVEGDLEFWGGSFVSDPFGRVLAESGASGEALLLARLDLAEIDRTRRLWPFLRDRRIDAYGGLLRRHGSP